MGSRSTLQIQNAAIPKSSAITRTRRRYVDKNSSDLDPRAELAAKQWAEWRASRRHLIKIGAFSGAGLALGGVAAGSGPFLRSAAAQDATPKVGGSIRMSLADDDAQNFDPIIPTDNMSIWTMLLFYDTLIRVGPDGNSLEPGLASSWTHSDDGLTYTFTIREATFHDGSPVTSADVIYSLGRTLNSPDSQWAFLFPAGSTFAAPDDRTAVITLPSPWAPLEADLALFGAAIIPKALHEAQGEALFQQPIGSGPFIFESWEKQVQIVLKKNPNYWEPGLPYLDELTFLVLTDANARMLQFQGGDLDIATSVPYSQVESLKANPDVTFHEEAVARIDYFGINCQREPFTDVKVRQALNYAVNKDVIIQNVLFGAGQLANTYLPLMYGHDDTVPGYTYDLDKAKALLAETAVKDGFEAELLITTGDPVTAQIAQLVAADLEKIGVKLNVTVLEPAAKRDRRNAFDFDLNSGYYTTDVIDPDELTNFGVETDGGAFAVWTNYRNEDVNAMIRAARTELDVEKRLQMYHDIQKQVTEDAHFLYLYYPTGNTVTQKAIQSFKILPTGNYRLWETWRDDV
jgi:peptide/nickel transport system substrate-binding protein